MIMRRFGMLDDDDDSVEDEVAALDVGVCELYPYDCSGLPVSEDLADEMVRTISYYLFVCLPEDKTIKQAHESFNKIFDIIEHGV